MTRPRRTQLNLWQSFADLGLGLMAVLILILVLLLSEQRSQNAQFAQELLKAVKKSSAVVEEQDRIRKWVDVAFSQKECRLQFDKETQELSFAQTKGGDLIRKKAADLYQTGKTALSDEGKDALASCQTAFELLATCLSDNATLRRKCTKLEQKLGIDTQLLQKNRASDVEALVLEGSTDRSPMSVSTVYGLNAKKKWRKNGLTNKYISNAQLGAERARQAAGHIIESIRKGSPKDDLRPNKVTPLKNITRKLRVETNSIATSWDLCPESDKCPQARRLSLRLRLKQESLRKPFSAIQKFFCSEVKNPKSALHLGLIETGELDDALNQCVGL